MNNDLALIYLFNLFILSTLVLFSTNVLCDEPPLFPDESAEFNDPPEEELQIAYVTPTRPKHAYIFEPLDNIAEFEKRWIKSKAKKEEVDEDISKYDGVWALESMEKDALTGDNGLVLKSKAKHAAISAQLQRPFVFKDKPFIVQYEINFQNGQECGGAYIKLLSNAKEGLNLSEFNDKSPYTIMFGPDKCGNDYKFHFIFRHVNPITSKIDEKHCKRPKNKLEDAFKDNRVHLYTLLLNPDNSYQMFMDHNVINSGNLLEDFTPHVNPPKEIDDPNDMKPLSWDEREKIPDPSESKPEDWDENAPQKILDHFAFKPEGWLDDQPELIEDPEASKPADWDQEMDGEWEAPLVPNPLCASAPGCSEWKRPMVDNPEYKGKWKAKIISNPNYQGKWAPRRIANPDYFEDMEPFKMTSIGAIGLELWSMSDGIYFDNFLITETMNEANEIAAHTFDLKVLKLEKGQKSYIRQIVEFSNNNPWIYGVYVLALAIPVVLVIFCCCSAEDIKEDEEALKKKTDEETADDPVQEEKKVVEEAEAEAEAEDDDDDEEEEREEAQLEEEQNDEDAPKSESEPENEKSGDETRTSPRLRKLRKE